MPELIALVFLAKYNVKSALQRGRSRTLTVPLTVLLWLVPEAIGLILGQVLFGPLGPGHWLPQYLIGLVFGLMGGGASFVLARRGQPRPPAPQAAPLPTGPVPRPHQQPGMYQPGATTPLKMPCRVVLHRQENAPGAPQPTHLFSLNGKPLGPLLCGASLEFETEVGQNRVADSDSAGLKRTESFYFEAPAGGTVELMYGETGFVPEATRITPGPAELAPRQELPDLLSQPAPPRQAPWAAPAPVPFQAPAPLYPPVQNAPAAPYYAAAAPVYRPSPLPQPYAPVAPYNTPYAPPTYMAPPPQAPAAPYGGYGRPPGHTQAPAYVPPTYYDTIPPADSFLQQVPPSAPYSQPLYGQPTYSAPGPYGASPMPQAPRAQAAPPPGPVPAPPPEALPPGSYTLTEVPPQGHNGPQPPIS